MPEEQTVEETVKKIAMRILRKSDVTFSPDTTFKDFGADSLDIVQILVAVEDAYDIEIPDEDLENVSDMESFIACIEKVIARKNG